MHSSLLLAVSGMAALATAQTFSDCNPMKKTGCANNPAIAQNFETNFKAGKDAVKGWKQTAGSLDYNADGALFTIKQKGDAPTIQTEGYLQFGRIDVVCKSAQGQGIISSIVLESDVLDEVDWEFTGTANSEVQMNFFGKGNTTTYDRMIPAPVSNTLVSHKYSLDWTAEKLDWLVDDKVVRSLPFSDAKALGGKNYPQTPSNVRIGIWAGGDKDNEKGVIEWAGGETDYSKAPFTMIVESVKITNYSPGKEYKYKDQTGDYKSIEVIEPGNSAGAPVNSAVISSAPAPSGSAAASGGNGQGLGTNVNVPTSGSGSKATGGDSKPTGSDSKPTGSGSKPSGGAGGAGGSTVYLTSMYTVTSCGATVTNCPAKVHTTVIPHTTGANGEKTPCSEGSAPTTAPSKPSSVPSKPSSIPSKPSSAPGTSPAAPSSPASSKPVGSSPPSYSSPPPHSSRLPIGNSSIPVVVPSGGICTGGVVTVTVTSGHVPSGPATPPPVIVSTPPAVSSPVAPPASSLKTQPSILPPSPTTISPNGTAPTPSQFTGAAAAATGMPVMIGGLAAVAGWLVL